jgi:serine/threonine-protein kinase
MEGIATGPDRPLVGAGIEGRSLPDIPGYEILGELGRGGMGVVYLARQVRLNRPCALKMILAGVHAGPDAILRFQAEAKTIARLRHPNIVQIYALGDHDGRSYFEMEYVEGGSLDRTIRGTPHPPPEAARLVELLSRAVAEAHRLGIIHRDLKPGNVLLTADGTPKITDFGLAKALGADSGLTRSESVLGSPSYMAPEQAEGKARTVGYAADVYALGAILYELLTGRPPFRGATVMETLEQVKTAEPVAPGRLVPGTPRDLETIALTCLRKEPGKRYGSAEALAEDLRRFLAGEPIRGRRTGPIERAWRWARRHPAVAGLSMMLLLVLVGGLATTTLQWARAEGLRSVAVAERQHAFRLGAEAEQRRQQAEANAVEADRQRARAEANLATARAAVDDYLNKVASDRLLKAPGLQILRRDLLRSALQFYGGFLRERGGDPELRAASAEVHGRVGRIQRELGDRGAEASFRAARDLYRALVDERPDDRAAHRELGHCLVALGQPGEAIALLEPLLRESPGDDRVRRVLAEAYNALAIDHQVAGRTADALHAHQRALQLREASARARPEDPEARTELASTFNNLGVLLDHQGQSSEALEMYLRSLEHYEAASGRAPQDEQLGRWLGTVYSNVTSTLRRLGRREEALRWLRKAVEHWARLARENPLVPRFDAEFYRAGLDLASLRRELGQDREASEALRRTSEAIDALPRGSPEDLFRLACVRAQVAAALEADLPAAEAARAAEVRGERDRQAEAAVGALRRAVAAGFVAIESLETSPDLAPLRGRTDFRALLDQLRRARAEALAGRTKPGGRAGGRLEEDLRTLAVREALARINPTDQRRRADLAASHHAIGLVHLELGQIDEASEWLRRSLADRERLGSGPGAGPEDRLDLAWTLIALGTARSRSDRLAEAHRLWRRALELAGAATDTGLPEGRRADLARARLRIGESYGELGFWDEAAAQYTAAFRLAEPDTFRDWYQYAMLLHVIGDRDGHRRLCDRLLERCGWPGGREGTGRAGGVLAGTSLESLVHVCVLAPGAGAGPEPLIAMAERALREAPASGWRHFTLAHALYRAGRSAEAVRRLEEGAVSAPSWAREQDCLRLTLLAMAHQARGRGDEARLLLDQADRAFDGRFQALLDRARGERRAEDGEVHTARTAASRERPTIERP